MQTKKQTRIEMFFGEYIGFVDTRSVFESGASLDFRRRKVARKG